MDFSVISLRRVVAVSGLILAAQSAQAAPAIIGGQEVSASDQVAQVTVAVYDRAGGLCTGSLIDKDLVLTAAHCVESGAKSLSVLFTRNINSMGNAPVAKVLGAVTPPGWTGVDNAEGIDQHDIALIRFKGALPAGYKVADTLTDSSELAPGVTTLLAGYGISTATANDPMGMTAGVLRKAEVSIESKLGKTEIVLDQTTGKGACHGDSGGPAYLVEDGKLILWGVTNRGYPDNAPDDCAHKAVYTNLNAYRAWLNEAAAQLRQIAE